jgi:hypothetical protein
MTQKQSEESLEHDESESCVEGMTRSEFVRTLVRKSLMAGALFTAVSATQQFKLPAAYAGTAAATSVVG